MRVCLVGMSMRQKDIIFLSQVPETPDLQEEEKRNEY